MNNRNEELRNYILKAQGISRTALNVMAFIGVFTTGWLIAVVFSFLGKGGIGWAYLIPMIILFSIARFSEGPLLWVLAIIGLYGLYIGAWVHANVILSHYESAAKQRLAEIDRQGETRTDTMLEKGLLLYKVLQEKGSAVNVLADALQMPDGDPALLNLAGVIMSKSQRYKEAAQLFDRALTSAKDEALIKQIKKNRKSVSKKIA